MFMNGFPTLQATSYHVIWGCLDSMERWNGIVEWWNVHDVLRHMVRTGRIDYVQVPVPCMAMHLQECEATGSTGALLF